MYMYMYVFIFILKNFWLNFNDLLFAANLSIFLLWFFTEI